MNIPSIEIVYCVRQALPRLSHRNASLFRLHIAPDEWRIGAWRWMEQSHRYNTLLWNEEDKARRTDVDAGEIAASKRLIDQTNQKRMK